MRRALLGAACTVAVSTFLVSARPAPDERDAAIARAHVWQRTNIPAMNITQGPTGPGAFPFRATVECDYVTRDMSGRSPKFTCRVGRDDEVKVKFGGTNGEVYAEVAASRLLWALGFAADRMYPVRVICRGCPREFNGTARENGDFIFDPASIERKRGEEISAEWAWEELDRVDEKGGGAPPAHRDALKLLAVFLQHTDSKPQQQRLVCLDQGWKTGAACRRPVMMINDLGLTFGRATWFNANDPSGMNLDAWSKTPVWKDAAGCVGNLPKSFTGTLDDPVISEAGRRFLASLLAQLTDRQIRDLFTVARVSLRGRVPGDGRDGFATVEEWADAFRQKRAEIVNRRCTEAPARS
jgi:hypothetical protein